MTEDQHVPSRIAAFVAHLTADTGATPEVTRVKPNRWRIAVDNGRVRMWVEYDILSRGRLKWTGSQLFVDGVQVRRADSYGQFVEIFRDPDGDTPRPEPVYEDVDPATAPTKVRKTYAALISQKHRISDKAQIRVQNSGHYWRIVLHAPRLELRMRYVTCYMNSKHPEQELQTISSEGRPIELFVDGNDLTEQVNGSLTRAMSTIAEHIAAAPPPSIAGPAAAKVNTSVQVRRQTVIRT